MKGWVTLREGKTLTIARPGRQRFDLVVEATWAPRPISRTRLAHQIRQDLWRHLQNVRGFSPIVSVSADEAIQIRAGGQLSGMVPSARLGAKVLALLENPRHQSRWLHFAERRG